jgi:hypothetical protein
MDRGAQVLRAGEQLHREHALRHELGGVRADEVDAHDPVRGTVHDDLREAVAGPERRGSARGGEGDLPRFGVHPGRPCLLLGEAGRGDLGPGEHHLGDRRGLERGGQAAQCLGGHAALGRGLVGQRRARGDVADGVGGPGGAALEVDGDQPAGVHGDAGALEAEVVRVGPPADGDDDVLGADARRPLRPVEEQVAAVEARRARAQAKVHLQRVQLPQDGAGQALGDRGQHPVERLHHGHAGAQAAKAIPSSSPM